MKIKAIEMTNRSLDWAVAKIEDKLQGPDNPLDRPQSYSYRPSTDGRAAIPIMEREGIELQTWKERQNERVWLARCTVPPTLWMRGPTPLIAAMRSYAALHLGDEIDVPDALLETAYPETSSH
jgi:hypothetical protein